MKEMYYINDQVLAVIGAIRSRQPRVGGLKLWQMLNKGGIPVGRDKVFRLLGERVCLVKPRKKRSTRPTRPVGSASFPIA